MGILFLFSAISLGISLYAITYASQQAINEEKETKLLQIAGYLCGQLGDMTYDDILLAENAQDATRQEKIEVLNRALAEQTDEVASMFNGLAIGYYSLELDAILTYGPSTEYGHTIGVSIGADHPGREVMANNEPLVKIGSMVRGNIMNAMVPIEDGGKVIGYAWANELTSDIQEDYRQFSMKVILLASVFFIIAITLSFILSRRMMRNMDSIITHVKIMRNDLTKRIPCLKGELSEVSESINSMAEHLEKNAKEHEALLRAEAANLAQRDFLARMSHEIRTPMNGVLGMTKLAMRADSHDKILEYLQKIQSSATLLLGIINDILDFSKIEANMLQLDLSPFDLRESINNLGELIAPRIEEKNLALDVSVDDSVPSMVVGDGLKLSQTLLNLLGNAVKFTEKGRIGLTVRAETAEDNRYKLICAVTDTGIGMNESQIEKLFQPFTQADSSTVRKYGGTGLGLSISKAFVKLMGGDIRVKSKLDEGSVFEFYAWVNACEQTGDIAKEDSGETVESKYPGVKTLLAEDIEINQEIAVVVLSDLGLVCDVAENGEVAVEMYKNKAYDLIFMDIRMPIMDGLEATRAIRGLEAERGGGSRIPIIAMTANAMQEDRELSMESGMDAHVSKPIDIDEIKNALDKVFQAHKFDDKAEIK